MFCFVSFRFVSLFYGYFYIVFLTDISSEFTHFPSPNLNTFHSNEVDQSAVSTSRSKGLSLSSEKTKVSGYFSMVITKTTHSPQLIQDHERWSGVGPGLYP